MQLFVIGREGWRTKEKMETKTTEMVKVTFRRNREEKEIQKVSTLSWEIKSSTQAL